MNNPLIFVKQYWQLGYQAIHHRLATICAATCILLLPFTCFMLTVIYQLSPYVNVLGVAMALPGLLLIRQSNVFLWSTRVNFVALVSIITFASVLLWHHLLSGQAVDLAQNLFIVLMCLVCAAAHHILSIYVTGQSKEKTDSNSVIEKAMKGPPVLIVLVLALVMCNGLMAFIASSESSLGLILKTKLLSRGIIPPLTLWFFLWGMSLIIIKWYLTSRLLKHTSTLKKSYRKVISARNAASAGKVGEVSDAFFFYFWQQFDSFYAIPRYINWALPILGFLGTVLGISQATEGLGVIILDSSTELSQVLGQALSPLGTAFDTTLIALSLAVVFGLSQTLLYRWEERHFLSLEENLKAASA